MQVTNNSIKLIFFGDITGKVGRNSVKQYLSSCAQNCDFVMANIENASHGFGLTKKNYLDLSDYINCMTSGNHIWDKKDIYEYINGAENIVRPINYPAGTPGKGSQIFCLKNQKIGVINALGRVFMPPIDSPWQVVTGEIERMKSEGVSSVLIDFHSEATAEKICFARYLAEKYNSEDEKLIKGFFGTHTHVQTADEKIINGMAYITDAGFCGAYDSVIGMEYTTSLKRLTTSLPERYEVAADNVAQVNGVEVQFNELGATHIERINCLINTNENEKEAYLESGV